jgi:hypothetical protein
MHQDGREVVTGPFFGAGRDALRRLLCKTGLSKTRVLAHFLGMASKSQSLPGRPSIAAKCAGVMVAAYLEGLLFPSNGT